MRDSRPKGVCRSLSYRTSLSRHLSDVGAIDFSPCPPYYTTRKFLDIALFHSRRSCVSWALSLSKRREDTRTQRADCPHSESCTKAIAFREEFRTQCFNSDKSRAGAQRSTPQRKSGSFAGLGRLAACRDKLEAYPPSNSPLYEICSYYPQTLR
jgi:hypothetical protein